MKLVIYSKQKRSPAYRFTAQKTAEIDYYSLNWFKGCEQHKVIRSYYFRFQLVRLIDPKIQMAAQVIYWWLITTIRAANKGNFSWYSSSCITTEPLNQICRYGSPPCVEYHQLIIESSIIFRIQRMNARLTSFIFEWLQCYWEFWKKNIFPPYFQSNSRWFNEWSALA